MKVAVLFVCGLTLVSATGTLSPWSLFKAKYGKKYQDLSEEAFRKSVFDDNQQFIDDFNEKFANGEVSFSVRMNQFGDMTLEEFNAVMKGYNGAQKRSSVAQHVSRDEGVPQATDVDWRQKGAVTQVKNQEQCGSCWAFSATGSLEGQHFLKTGTLVSLSEQNLVDCSGDFGNFGCGGGLMDNAFDYIKKNEGVDTEASYPYEAKDGVCRFSKDNIGATCTGYVDIQEGNETNLMTAVRDVGPVSVGIDASHQTFQFYDKGVYFEPDCSERVLDHGVLAVGYGSQDSLDFWLVKNSWGTDWGTAGYINMARNKDNNCGIATAASYPLV
nr:digestive cysteine proteinase 2-like [Procambarus clarkii]